MKLRFLTVCLILILLSALTCIPALADAIFEPRDDFYMQESENCVYTNRSYTANGADGTVDVLKEPGSKDIVATINNGNEFYVSFTYTDKDGTQWGVVMFNPDTSGNLAQTDNSKAVSGWIRMTDLTVVYDYISFAEDHETEFKPYTGTYEEFKSGGKVVLWKYPGSGIIVSQIDKFEYNEYFEISDTYTDSEGRVWGSCVRNMWVCISDPSGAGIELAPSPSSAVGGSTTAPASASTTTQSPELPIVEKNQSSMLILIAAIVAAVVIVTGVLIAIFWKKGAKKDGVTK